MTNGTANVEEKSKSEYLVNTKHASVSLPQVVHSSAAEHDYVMWLIMSLSFIAIIVFGLMVAKDATVPSDEKRIALLRITGAFAFATVIVLLIIPKEFQVVSDASVNVVTFVAIKWNYKGATAAFDGNSVSSEWYRPKIKYASSFCKTVVIRRKNGAWDLILSPADPERFINAVYLVTADKERK